MKKDKTLASFINPVFGFLKTIPKGRAVTYKEVAQRCLVPSARNVGWILRKNSEPDQIPCYKVVCSNGRLARGYKFGGAKAQKRRLMEDGVKFNAAGKVQKISIL